MKMNEEEAAISSSWGCPRAGCGQGGMGVLTPAPPAQRDEMSQGNPDVGEGLLADEGQLPLWAQSDELVLLYRTAKPGLSCPAGMGAP